MQKKHHKKTMEETELNQETDNIADTSASDVGQQEKKTENVVSAAEEQISDSAGEPSVASSTETPEDYKAKYDELYNKYLRLAAEYDNYRKRTLKEKADLLKYGGETVLSNLLPVIDDWERALRTIETAQDVDAIKQGIILIHNKFRDFLQQNGIKEIEALEKDFDLEIHEAISKIPSENLKGKVVDVIQKGYFLYDKVLRHSKVIVGE